MDGTPREGTHPAAARAHGVARAQASTKPRKVDPTTTDRQYSAAELEFLRAIDAYKARTGRAFPTYTEVFRILLDLGYRQFPAPDEEPPCAA